MSAKEYFTELLKDADQFFMHYSGRLLLVEPKIDGEDLLILRAKIGEAFCINRYDTHYVEMPFVKDIPEINEDIELTKLIM